MAMAMAKVKVKVKVKQCQVQHSWTAMLAVRAVRSPLRYLVLHRD
jgi:hypothetical protein